VSGQLSSIEVMWLGAIHDAPTWDALAHEQANWSRAIWRPWQISSLEHRAENLEQLAAIASVANARWHELLEHRRWRHEGRAAYRAEAFLPLDAPAAGATTSADPAVREPLSGM
jgi:hypothetical protein